MKIITKIVSTLTGILLVMIGIAGVAATSHLFVHAWRWGWNLFKF